MRPLISLFAPYKQPQYRNTGACGILFCGSILMGEYKAESSGRANLFGIQVVFWSSDVFSYAIADGLYNLLFPDKTGELP